MIFYLYSLCYANMLRLTLHFGRNKVATGLLSTPVISSGDNTHTQTHAVTPVRTRTHTRAHTHTCTNLNFTALVTAQQQPLQNKNVQ